MKVLDRYDLTYCSNIHAGDAWVDVRTAIGAALPEIRRALAVAGPLAIGLRLSARAAEELARPDVFAEFCAFLHDGDYYVPTINGFPYSAFHGERVKERVYLPDWRDPARVTYSNRLATLLAALLSERGIAEGSVSTVPGAFKGHLRSNDDTRDMASGIFDHVAHLVRVREETGVVVMLAIEPEPACFIETTDEAVAFFTQYLFDHASVANWSNQRGVTLTVDQVRRHVGVCFDVCHMAVVFDDAATALDRLARAGIRVPKFQISSALRVGDVSPHSAGRAALARFAEDTYLHQVAVRGPDGVSMHVDLPEALAKPAPAGSEWRIHFHVPVFLEQLGALQTTQPELRAALALLRDRTEGACLEVETYTWDVLPETYRTVGTAAAIARELAWTRDQLQP